MPRAAATLARPREVIARISGDSLYRNSFMLIANNAIQGALGFAFWMVASHLFDAAAVGIATAVVSASLLASSAATLGMPNTILRFLATEEHPRRLVVSALVASTGFAALAGLLWGAVPGTFGTPLDRLGPVWLTAGLAAVLLVAMTASTVGDAAIVARRESRLVVGKNALGAVLKLAVLPFVVGFDVAGLMGAVVLGAGVSSVAGLVILARRIGIGRRTAGDFSPAVLRSRFSYVAGNHLATLVALVPSTILPTLAVAMLGPRQAAYLAMPLQIIAFLNVIPAMSAQSLFAELSSDPERLLFHVLKALRGAYLLVLPACLLVAALAPLILRAFGEHYSRHGTTALRLMALGCLIGCLNYVGDVALIARSRVKAYVVVNVAGTVVVMAALLAGLTGGVTGVGRGWVAGQVGYAAIVAAGLYVSFGRRVSSSR